MDRKTELVTLICREIAAEDDLNSFDWKSVAIVLEAAKGRMSNAGYLYTQDKVVPTSADSSALVGYAKELRTLMQVPGEEPWREMLVQIRRADGRVRVDFHYGDEPRWPIGPATMERMKSELRPDFE